MDDRTIHLRVGVRDVYRLDLAGVCPDLQARNQIAISGRGSTFACSAFDATLIVEDPFGRPQRCEVKQVRKLTPEEVAALPARERP